MGAGFRDNSSSWNSEPQSNAHGDASWSRQIRHDIDLDLPRSSLDLAMSIKISPRNIPWYAKATLQCLTISGNNSNAFFDITDLKKGHDLALDLSRSSKVRAMISGQKFM
jgi:hypothetical protein